MKRIEPSESHIRYASNYIYCKGRYCPRPLLLPKTMKLEQFDRECEATIYLSGVMVVTEEDNHNLPSPLNPSENNIISIEEMQALLLSISKPNIYISKLSL
ncbi:MAG: hypothetical protein Q4A76_01325 [Porphyromonadaceae bacterium]|nr:hypothetical protein [Porphyromonadaceae bacterium]